MTAREAAQWLNREGTLTVGELSIGVRVVDARRNWGAVHVLVEPLNGSGEQWVDSARVKLTAAAVATVR